MKKEKYDVTGMTCAACQANVTKCVQKLEGVEEVNVSLLANQMTVSYDEAKLAPDAIIGAVQAIGYGAALHGQAAAQEGGFRSEWQTRQERAEENQRGMKHRLIASIALLDAPHVYCHGTDDFPASTGFFGRHGKFSGFGSGPAGADCADYIHQLAFFPEWL